MGVVRRPGDEHARLRDASCRTRAWSSRANRLIGPLGAILTTQISPGVWHIAQVATDPLRRRRGLARRLVGFVCASAAASGAREVTLVVDERNVAARALYDSLGFTDARDPAAGVPRPGHANVPHESQSPPLVGS